MANIDSTEKDIARNIAHMDVYFAKTNHRLDTQIAIAKSPVYIRALEKRRKHAMNHCETQKKLFMIHLDIARKQDLFLQEKNKWLAENFRQDIMDQDVFYSKKRQWEIDFTESHLKPLYEERRRIVARGISYFWGLAIFLDKRVKEQFTKKDEQIRKFLIDIESSWSSNKKGFQLKFTFDDNPYFENQILTKTYDVIGDNNSVTLKAIGSQVHWLSSCPLTRGQRSKSFFSTFFDSYATIKPISFDTERGELKGKIPRDYIIGTLFRDKIIPLATYGCVPIPSRKPYFRDPFWNPFKRDRDIGNPFKRDRDNDTYQESDGNQKIKKVMAFKIKKESDSDDGNNCGQRLPDEQGFEEDIEPVC